MDLTQIVTLSTALIAAAGAAATWRKVSVDGDDVTIEGFRKLVAEQRTELDRVSSQNKSLQDQVSNFGQIVEGRVTNVEKAWQLRMEETERKHQDELQTLRKQVEEQRLTIEAQANQLRRLEGVSPNRSKATRSRSGEPQDDGQDP